MSSSAMAFVLALAHQLPQKDRHVRAGGFDRFLYGGTGLTDRTLGLIGVGNLGRDLVELAVESQGLWDHKLPDDAALGAVLAASGVAPAPAPRQDILRLRDVRKVDTSQYHIRCRTDSWRRRRDAQIMRRVHRAFLAARA
jgi:hypothetical protein